MRKTTDAELSILKWTENTKGHPRVEDCREIAEYDIVSGCSPLPGSASTEHDATGAAAHWLRRVNRWRRQPCSSEQPCPSACFSHARAPPPPPQVMTTFQLASNLHTLSHIRWWRIIVDEPQLGAGGFLQVGAGAGGSRWGKCCVLGGWWRSALVVHGRCWQRARQAGGHYCSVCVTPAPGWCLGAGQGAHVVCQPPLAAHRHANQPCWWVGYGGGGWGLGSQSRCTWHAGCPPVVSRPLL